MRSTVAAVASAPRRQAAHALESLRTVPGAAPSTRPRSASVPVDPLRRQAPKVGAVCGKAARTDLCGGPGATRVPTATGIHSGSEPDLQSPTSAEMSAQTSAETPACAVPNAAVAVESVRVDDAPTTNDTPPNSSRRKFRAEGCVLHLVFISFEEACPSSRFAFVSPVRSSVRTGEMSAQPTEGVLHRVQTRSNRCVQ